MYNSKNKSKVITIKYSDEKDDVFHYRVIIWGGKKRLIGWPGVSDEKDNVFNDDEEYGSYDITDLADLSLYEFHRLYMQLAIHGHLLNLEETVCEQTPIFADEDWKIAKLVDKIEKE